MFSYKKEYINDLFNYIYKNREKEWYSKKDFVTDSMILISEVLKYKGFYVDFLVDKLSAGEGYYRLNVEKSPNTSDSYFEPFITIADLGSDDYRKELYIYILNRGFTPESDMIFISFYSVQRFECSIKKILKYIKNSI